MAHPGDSHRQCDLTIHYLATQAFLCQSWRENQLLHVLATFMSARLRLESCRKRELQLRKCSSSQVVGKSIEHFLFLLSLKSEARLSHRVSLNSSTSYLCDFILSLCPLCLKISLYVCCDVYAKIINLERWA